MEEITAWLARHHLEKYASTFIENDIDVDVLASLTEGDFKELGVSLGHRRRIQQAIAKAESASEDTAPDPDATAQRLPPHAALPNHLARRIIESRYALTGERKQVTVLFADIKGSMALIAGMDPEYASQMMDPTVQAMMSAVHRFEGTVNRVLGDGIMALFGAPIAHEDHAIRACYAALAMRAKLAELSEQTRLEIGVDVEVRIGINSGEVVVRAISNDLTMNYDAVGETTHLAARMEQTAKTGSIRISDSTFRLSRDYIVANPLGAIPVKGMPKPVDAYELAGASAIRTRIQASAAAGFSPFVGRHTELALIEDLQTSALEGRGQVVAVVGEPGVGKSRLYYEYVHSSRVDGWLVLECGTVSHGKASAFAPITDLMRGYFGVDSGEGPRLVRERVLGRVMALDERLKNTVSAFLALLDVPVEDEDWTALDPPIRRKRIQDAVRAVLLQAAAERPLVLVFEDLHWFDGESLGVLAGLIDNLGGTNILMLVNFRPEFTEATWADRTYYNPIRLNPLRPDSSTELLEHLLGPAPELQPLKTMLIERTEGNPFFLEQSVRSLIENNALAGDRGAHRLSDPDAHIETPASVHAVLSARMDRLEPDCKYVLQCAAVIGKDFSEAVLEKIVGLEGDTLDAALSALQSDEFVYETRLFPEKEYTFKHALIHEVAYDSVMRHRRVELHAGILDAIEQDPHATQDEHIDRLAHHALQGERWDLAFEYGRLNGHRLEEHNATRQAIDAYNQALEAFEHLDESEERLRNAIDLHFRIRDAYFVFGDPEKIGPHLEAAEALARRTKDVSQLAWSRLQHAAAQWANGNLEVGLREADAALTYAADVSEPGFESLAFYRRGICLVGLGRMPEAQAVLERAFPWLSTDEGRSYFQLGGYPYVFVCAFLAWSLAEQGKFEEGIKYGRLGFAHAEREKHTYSMTVAGFGLADALILAGRGTEAVPTVERAVDSAREAGAYAATAWSMSRLTYAYAVDGQRDKALELIDHIRDPDVHHRSPHLMSVRLWVARALAELGELDSALAELDVLEPIATVQGEQAVLGWARWQRAHIGLTQNAADQAARRLVHEAIEIAHKFSLVALERQCQATLNANG